MMVGEVDWLEIAYNRRGNAMLVGLQAASTVAIAAAFNAKTAVVDGAANVDDVLRTAASRCMHGVGESGRWKRLLSARAIATRGQADEVALAAGDGGDDDIRLMGGLDRSRPLSWRSAVQSWLRGMNSDGSGLDGECGGVTMAVVEAAGACVGVGTGAG
ncbi:hypothetical protein ACLOJK_037751 [Asimina triloba]